MTPKQINTEGHFWKKWIDIVFNYPMKKFLLLPFFFALVIAGAFFWFYRNSQAPASQEKYDYFLIKKGESASEVGKRLEEEGFIKSAFAFKIFLQATGQTGNIQTGEFKLTPSHSLFQTVDALFKGPIELWVTIPEGLRREEIALKFASVLGKDQSFISDFLNASEGKEGYLFPDTYLFPREATASQIVSKMEITFENKTKDIKNNSGLSFEEVVVLASLIERETKTEGERPVVAGIMLNRLDAGMPLQIDAAVQYAVANNKCQTVNAKCSDWWPILTLDDLSIKSPYNTYKNKGLPNAPIASPGLSSLKAAFSPEANDYWYYIHDPKGVIHYATTLSEHNSNIAKYLGR